MRILRTLLFILLFIALLVVLLGLFARKEYHIERSIEIDAPKELIMEQVRYFANFNTWSPWAVLDPNMKETIEGVDGSVGAVHSWSGNDDVGEGKQSITALSDDRIDILVEFTKPFKSTSPTFISVETLESGLSKVHWGFDMRIPFPWNGFAMFTDVDAGVGRDYTRGLENLRRLCEGLAHPKYNGYEPVRTAMEETVYLGIRREIPFAEMPEFYQTSYPQLMEFLQQEESEPTGPPSGLYWFWNDSTQMTDVAAAFSIGAETGRLKKPLQYFTLPAGDALIIDYLGAYEGIAAAHIAMDSCMAHRGLESIPPIIEAYITDPATEPDTSKWLTKVIYYVKQKSEPEPEDTE